MRIQELIDLRGATRVKFLQLPDFPTSAAIGLETATVDLYTNIKIAQSTPNINLSIPAPTSIIDTNLLFLTNNGTVPFTVGNTLYRPGETKLNVWDVSWKTISDFNILDWVQTTYKKNEYVLAEGRMFRSNQDHVASLLFNTDRIKWDVVVHLPRKNYQDNFYYYADDEANYGDIVITKQINGASLATFVALEFPKWKLTSQGTVGPFSPGWFYFAGTKIIENNVIYERRVSGQAGLAFNAVEQQEWLVLGTKDTPVGVASQVKTSDYVVAPTDGTLILQPAAAMNVDFNVTLPENKPFTLAGVVDTTKPITVRTIGVGVLITDPASGVASLSFTNSGWVNGTDYYFEVRRIGNKFYIKQ